MYESNLFKMANFTKLAQMFQVIPLIAKLQEDVLFIKSFYFLNTEK